MSDQNDKIPNKVNEKDSEKKEEKQNKPFDDDVKRILMFLLKKEGISRLNFVK